MHPRVLAVDPGHTIGYAVMDPPARLVVAGQTHDEAEVFALLETHHPDEVVVERFRPYPEMMWALGFQAVAPAEMVERIKRVCAERGVPVIEQSSSQISEKGPFTDFLLRQLKLYQRGKVHANDAIRHALYRLWFAHGFRRDEDVADRLRGVLAEVIPTDAED